MAGALMLAEADVKCGALYPEPTGSGLSGRPGVPDERGGRDARSEAMTRAGAGGKMPPIRRKLDSVQGLPLNFVQCQVGPDQVECLLDGGVAVGVSRRSRIARV